MIEHVSQHTLNMIAEIFYSFLATGSTLGFIYGLYLSWETFDSGNSQDFGVIVAVPESCVRCVGFVVSCTLGGACLGSFVGTFAVGVALAGLAVVDKAQH